MTSHEQRLRESIRDLIQEHCSIEEPLSVDCSIVNELMEVIKEQVLESLTNAMHPDFGWWWREEEDGGKAIKAAYAQGWNDRAQDKGEANG